MSAHPQLFVPGRTIRAHTRGRDGEPEVYDFESRLTQDYVDEVNKELVARGQRPAFIRWDAVHLVQPSDAPRHHGLFGTLQGLLIAAAAAIVRR